MSGGVVYSMNVSLDGYVETPDKSIEWIHIDEEIHRAFNEQDAAIAAHLYGRGMWEVMASYWPTADRNPEAPEWEVQYARIWQAIPIVVVSRSLASVDEPNARLVRGNAAEELVRLRSTVEGDVAVGGPRLAASLIERDLVDDFRLFIQPRTIGAGTPYFPPGARLDLRLVETHTFASGVIYIRYERSVRGPASGRTARRSGRTR